MGTNRSCADVSGLTSRRAVAALVRTGLATAVLVILAGCQSSTATAGVDTPSGSFSEPPKPATESELQQAVANLKELDRVQSQNRARTLPARTERPVGDGPTGQASAGASQQPRSIARTARTPAANDLAKPAAQKLLLIDQAPAAQQAQSDTDAAINKPMALTANEPLTFPTPLSTSQVNDMTSPGSLINLHASTLARLLAQRASSTTGTARSRDLASLAMLRAIEPGAQTAIDGIKPSMVPSCVRALDALAAIANAMNETGYDDTQLPEVLHRTAQSINGSPLTVSAVALATAVESFGRYTPIGTDIFLTGQKTPLLLYTEVADFKNSKDATTGSGEGPTSSGGEFLVRLTLSIQLLSTSGIVPVINHGSEELRSTARSPRREMFIARRIEIPASVPPGSYVLKITVRDELANTQVERTLQLHMTADPTLAGRQAATAAPAR